MHFDSFLIHASRLCAFRRKVRKDSICSANTTTVILDGAARDNSLSVVRQPLEMESPPDTERVGAARLKRVCILDEEQIKLARKQPIHLSAGLSRRDAACPTCINMYTCFTTTSCIAERVDKMSTGTAESNSAPRLTGRIFLRVSVLRYRRFLEQYIFPPSLARHFFPRRLPRFPFYLALSFNPFAAIIRL